MTSDSRPLRRGREAGLPGPGILGTLLGVGLVLAAGEIVAPAAAGGWQGGQGAPEDLDALYGGLQEAAFDAAGALTVEGVRLEHGPATVVLERGTWIPLVPVGGRVTGAYFEGIGRLRFDPPEGTERGQLEKFSGTRTLDTPFSALYLRFTDDTVGRVTGRPGAAAGDLVGSAERARAEVRKSLLEDQHTNLEAKLLRSLLERRQDLFFAWVDTDDHGRLSFRQDPAADDHYRLVRWRDRYGGMLDVWSGVGAAEPEPALPEHVELDVTLEGEDLVETRATVQLRATRPGVRAVRFDLHPRIVVRSVRSAGGGALFFARERADGDAFDDGVTVVFPGPLDPRESMRVTFVLGGDIVQRVGLGRTEYALQAPVRWYPLLGYLRRATYEATFRVEEDHRVFASGELVSEGVEDGVRVFRYRQDFPVAIFSFGYGTMSTDRVEVDDVAPVTVFGDAPGLGAGSRQRNVGIDVANSLGMFSSMFGEYPFSYMYATRIPYPHGQGFPGLLHLSAGTFQVEVKGASEAFRAHEVAHQWWGHVVGWATYRDQWISEGFAEYSGAMYAAAYLDDPEVLDHMVEAWKNDVLRIGNIRTRLGFERYGFPPEVMRLSQGSWSGPISLGQRLSSSEAPADYQILVYEKGAYVLHMLRMLLRDLRTGSDDAFHAMMRDFVETFRGGEATTEGFQEVVERHAGGDMSWFFDQWVHGTAIPSYRWAWTAEEADDGVLFHLRIRQSVEPDVPFFMPILVRLDLGDGRSTFLRVPVREAEQVFDIPLPREPEEVVFNYGRAVLAEVDEEGW